MPRLSEAAPYVLPALCYAINNNMLLNIQSHFDPVTFSVSTTTTDMTTMDRQLPVSGSIKLIRFLAVNSLKLHTNHTCSSKSRQLHTGLYPIYCVVLTISKRQLHG